MTRHRQSSTFAELLALLFWPVVWVARRIFRTHQAGPDTIKRFYRSAEWKRWNWHRRLDPSNLQTLCASCNWGKGGR